MTGSKYWAHKFYQVNTSNNWYVNNGAPGNWTQVAGDPALTITADNTFTQTVTGLVASTSYVFQDFAFNQAGNGPTSATGAGSTKAAVASGVFSVSGGKVMRNGSPFIARGVSNYIIDPVSGNPQTTGLCHDLQVLSRDQRLQGGYIATSYFWGCYRSRERLDVARVRHHPGELYLRRGRADQ